MWCPACAWVIEESLHKEPGVNSVKCHFTTDHLKLEYNPVLTSPQHITGVIAKLGYRGSLPGDTRKGSKSRSEAIRLGISGFLTMNVMMLSFALYTGFFTRLAADTIHNITWPLVVMASVVFGYGGAPIHRRALSGLTAASPGMETLISVGASSAFFYSIYNWLTGSIHLYFDTASMLITLVLIGKTIEQRTKDRISAQIGSFFELLPAKVRICSEQFPQGRYADARMVSPGDILRVVAGEIIPADGRILEGHARVDESSLTGEAKPIHKSQGDSVSSGTTVIDGDLRLKALSVGGDSIVGQLVAVIEKTLDKKTRMEDTTDKTLRFFVPAIVLLALGTAAVCLAVGLDQQQAVLRAVTVMVISCPCALGVAIPLARVFSISLASNKGILVHHFSAFDRIKAINAFVFDKTGTLTKGQWELVSIVPLGEWTVEKILSMAAGLEKDSNHYAGEALVQASRNKGFTPATITDIKEIANGISGYFGQKHLKIGSASYLASTLKSSKVNSNPIHTPPTSAVSRIYMAVDDELCAIFEFGDVVRESSTMVADTLKQRDIRLAIVSGDGEQTTRTVGDIVGITDCHGSMLPDDKSAFVEKLKRQGHTVAMVGDGVNDVPALAAADLGIAVHSGPRIGIEASGITLMGNDPKQILAFEQLAHHVSRTIRQNLIFTFLYNIISIPLAMSGLLNPLIAVSAMLMSSLSVTGNTLLLKRRTDRL